MHCALANVPGIRRTAVVEIFLVRRVLRRKVHRREQPRAGLVRAGRLHRARAKVPEIKTRTQPKFARN